MREDLGKRGVRGYDAGKKVKGHKRHLLVDTQGLALGGKGLSKRYRTFAWLGFSHRLNRDDELLPESSETFICTAMIRLMVRRLAS